MKIKAYTLNAFAKTPDGGNPAGVVLSADKLTEAQMKSIASVIGFSETAFVIRSDKADFKVRFFTPTDEVDLCGHATIATFSTLLALEIVIPGNYTQETKAGILDVKVNEDRSILMDQNLPVYSEIVDKNEIAASLNITPDQIIDDLPVQVVSTGLRDIIIPVKSSSVLKAIKPNNDIISEISKKYNVTGYHIFTFDTHSDSIANCRNLAPLYGIPEESATGTSNGALACYLYKYNKLSDEQQKHMTIEQGYTMNKPSEIIAELHQLHGEISSVKVGGSALNLKEHEINLASL
jgi:PhzF family phenazine biosynthesis protein